MKGQNVTVQDPQKDKWIPGTVVDKLPEPRSYVVQCGNKQVRRNRSHLRDVPSPEQSDIVQNQCSDKVVQNSSSDNVVKYQSNDKVVQSKSSANVVRNKSSEKMNTREECSDNPDQQKEQPQTVVKKPILKPVTKTVSKTSNAQISENSKPIVTRSGRSVKTPARFKDYA